jgi:hypothetical protein
MYKQLKAFKSEKTEHIYNIWITNLLADHQADHILRNRTKRWSDFMVQLWEQNSAQEATILAANK